MYLELLSFFCFEMNIFTWRVLCIPAHQRNFSLTYVVPEPLKIQCLLDRHCVHISLLVQSPLCYIKLLVMKVMCCTFRFWRGIVSKEKFGAFMFSFFNFFFLRKLSF